MKKVRGTFNRSILDLPSEIIWQILIRLTIRACLSCKSVCKDWYDIITSSRFAELRRCHSSSFVALTHHSKKGFMMAELDKSGDNVDEMGNMKFISDGVVKFNPNFDRPIRTKLTVVNVCKGLVFIESHFPWSCYYICNMLTSQWVKVGDFRTRYSRVCYYGLGFCSMTRQYKVLSFIDTPVYGVYAAEVLTLGTRLWRIVNGTSKSCYKDGPFLNDSLHWYCDVSKCICAFHFGTEQFLNIPTPDKVPCRDYGFKVTVFDSCLSFCCMSLHEGDPTEVWLMKEYSVKDSWVRQFVIREEPWACNWVPLMRMDNGHILISDNSLNAFYDPETGEYKVAKPLRRIVACDVDFAVCQPLLKEQKLRS